MLLQKTVDFLEKYRQQYPAGNSFWQNEFVDILLEHPFSQSEEYDEKKPITDFNHLAEHARMDLIIAICDSKCGLSVWNFGYLANNLFDKATDKSLDYPKPTPLLVYFDEYCQTKGFKLSRSSNEISLNKQYRGCIRGYADGPLSEAVREYDKVSMLLDMATNDNVKVNTKKMQIKHYIIDLKNSGDASLPQLTYLLKATKEYVSGEMSADKYRKLALRQKGAPSIRLRTLGILMMALGALVIAAGIALMAALPVIGSAGGMVSGAAGVLFFDKGLQNPLPNSY